MSAEERDKRRWDQLEVTKPAGAHVYVGITLSYEEGRERVHCRVLGSPLQAKARKDDVMSRLVAEARAK